MKLTLASQTLDLDKRAHIMGILNVTPDSFTDGGKFVSAKDILVHAGNMVEAGADIIDVGGESSRPFADKVSLKQEIARVIPAIEAIRAHHSIPISIDTTKSEVARQAIIAGANIVNDISALRFDLKMIDVLLEYNVPVVIMHMQGVPSNMQIAPTYANVVAETLDFFAERISWLTSQGVKQEKIIIDPGIGFGKTYAHNLSILKHINDYNSLGCPLLVGHSRKAFIGAILENKEEERDIATAAISAILTMNKVAIIRVHEVKMNAHAIKVAQAIADAS